MSVNAIYKLRKEVPCTRCHVTIAKGEVAHVYVCARTGTRSGHRHIVCPDNRVDPMADTVPVSEQVAKDGEEPDWAEAARNMAANLPR